MATIKELINMDVAKLEAMSDAELKAYCEPFTRVVSTLPVEEEKSNIVDVSAKKRSSKESKSSEMWVEEAKRLGTKLGIDVSSMKLPAGLATKK